MSNSDKLSKTRKNTVINKESQIQEKESQIAIKRVISKIKNEFNYELIHEKTLKLRDSHKIIESIFPNSNNSEPPMNSTFISPDCGLVYLKHNNGNKLLIGCGEVKKQGTNDERIAKGLKTQGRGNAIERCGKNHDEIETLCAIENIFPYFVFGYGCDFEEGSTIPDRARSINKHGKLNAVHVYKEHSPYFIRCMGSYFVRKEKWTIEEMEGVMYDVMKQSIAYYEKKYGKKNLQKNT